jgi:hypothetical protein
VIVAVTLLVAVSIKGVGRTVVYWGSTEFHCAIEWPKRAGTRETVAEHDKRTRLLLGKGVLFHPRRTFMPRLTQPALHEYPQCRRACVAYADRHAAATALFHYSGSQ